MNLGNGLIKVTHPHLGVEASKEFTKSRFN